MKSIAARLAAARRRHARLAQGLSSTGYISQGSVQDRTNRRGGGAGYQWTRKVAAKTVSVSLTAEQYAQLKQAIANYRKLRKQIKELEILSRKIIFQETPHPNRRKSLRPKVLGIN